MGKCQAVVLLVCAIGAFCASSHAAGAASDPPTTPPAGMVWIAGGEFKMGGVGQRCRQDEFPVHRVRVDGFFMDTHEVTNAEFRKFAEATGYKTTAERKPVWEELKKQLPAGTEKPPDDKLQAGALVFTPPAASVPLNDVSNWWTWTIGASWQYPEGPGSSITGKDNHPVVQVSWDDATAYAKWAGKRLPTEAEWEYAARGGLEGKEWVWGDEPISEAHPQCNFWQGEFPNRGEAKDGFLRSAPVGSFKPNGYGLHDMAGNVWEWVADWYRPDTYASRKEAVTVNPQGPSTSFDPNEPNTAKRVERGGSFLCNETYCSSYRPSARMSCSADTGMQHVGFRCVMTPPRGGEPSDTARKAASETSRTL
jgi:formylglycine-generating enzyme